MKRGARWSIRRSRWARGRGVQNHYSLLHRSSEEGGILDYCKEKGITFFSYMVLEQGALTGKYDVEHPFDPNTGRGQAYNPHLAEISELTAALESAADKIDISMLREWENDMA